MQVGRQIGSWSLAAAVSTFFAAQLSHPVMLFPIQILGTATWLAVLAAGLLALLLYWPVAAATERLGGGSLIGLARAVGGVPLEILVAILLTAWTVFQAGAVLRETAEMAITAAYPHTPQTFAVVALSLCFLYGAWGRTTGIIRLGRLFLPGLLIAVVFALAGSAWWGKPRYLQPFWGEGPETVATNFGTLLSLYSPVLFLLMAGGHLRDPRNLARAGAVAIGAYTLLLAATTAVFLMVFPLPIGRSVAFPLHELARLTIGGRFFERLDGIWLCIWVFGTAIYLTALVHMAATAIAGAFGFSSHRLAILPLGVMSLTVALFPPDMGSVLVMHFAAWPFAGGVAFGLPALLALAGVLRRRRNRP